MQPHAWLRATLREARLDCFGLDIHKIERHPRALRLLKRIAAARRRGLDAVAQVCARDLLGMLKELT